MMFFSPVLYLNVLQLTRQSCNTLTRPCVPPPCLSHFPFCGYTFPRPNVFFPSFARLIILTSTSILHLLDTGPVCTGGSGQSGGRAGQTKGKSSSSLGGTSSRQGLRPPCITTVCTVLSPQQLNQGNTFSIPATNPAPLCVTACEMLQHPKKIAPLDGIHSFPINTCLSRRGVHSCTVMRCSSSTSVVFAVISLP